MRHLITGLLLLIAFCSFAAGPELIVAGRGALRRGEIDQAVMQLERAVAVNPNNYEGHYYLGLAYARRAQNEGILAGPALTTKAKDELARAVALNPNFAGARLELIELSGKTPKEARQSRRNARKLAPGPKGVGEAVRRVIVRTLENIAGRAAFTPPRGIKETK
jgi:Tfp pilus assembly protein PilF